MQGTIVGHLCNHSLAITGWSDTSHFNDFSAYQVLLLHSYSLFTYRVMNVPWNSIVSTVIQRTVNKKVEISSRNSKWHLCQWLTTKYSLPMVPRCHKHHKHWNVCDFYKHLFCLSSPCDVCDIQVLLDPSPRHDTISTGYLTEILVIWTSIRTTLNGGFPNAATCHCMLQCHM